MNWDDLRIFLTVAENGGISQAARVLSLSQPTVSQRLKDLEQRLNTQLLVRGPQGVSLTQAGRGVLEEAAVMRRAAATIDRLWREVNDSPAGRVRIAASEGVASFWLAPRAAAFQDANPGIALSIDVGLWPDDPVRVDVDVSLQFHDRILPGQALEPIATVHYAAFAAREYLERHGTPRAVAEIPLHRTVHHTGLREQQETWTPQAEAVRRLSAHNIETNSSSTLLIAAAAGGGVAFLPTAVAASVPNLVMLGDGPAASPVLYLAYDATSARVKRMELTLDWLRQVFDPETNPWFRPTFVHPDSFADVSPPGRFEVLAPGG